MILRWLICRQLTRGNDQLPWPKIKASRHTPSWSLFEIDAIEMKRIFFGLWFKHPNQSRFARLGTRLNTDNHLNAVFSNSSERITSTENGQWQQQQERTEKV
jgi:hypothetical protein